MIINKEKQREYVIQDEVFLYKIYAISLESSKPIFIQEEVYNLKKVLKTLQSLTKTI